MKKVQIFKLLFVLKLKSNLGTCCCQLRIVVNGCHGPAFIFNLMGLNGAIFELSCA